MVELNFIYLAISVGAIHTLLGPDHYLPFIALSKARQWSWSKTSLITFLCGLAHIGSAVMFGILGLAFKVSLEKLQIIEGFRGDLAAWALIVLGLFYLISSLKKQVLPAANLRGALVAIFVLGPCEPLIPLMLYPSVKTNFLSMLTIVGVFSLVTISTMMAAVWVGYYGINFKRAKFFEQYSGALAGIAIILCGLGIKVLGL